LPDFGTQRESEFRAVLRERLPEKTFAHVESVTDTIVSFHDKAGISLEQAVTAGLLHDVCKAVQKDDLREMAVRYGISEYLDVPNLLHGPVGAEFCRTELNITDDEVLDAIRYHTTGKVNWNPVGCALYIADFSEPRRPHPEAATAREMMDEKGFAETVHYVANTKTDYVRKNHEIDPNSEAFVSWIQTEYPI